VRFLKKNRPRAMAIRTTTAEPIAIPAMAPPLSLLESCEIVAWSAGGEVDVELEEEDVVELEG